MIDDDEQVAAALGADLSDPAIAADADRFDTSLAAFQGAVSPTAEDLYAAVPEHSAELSDFVSWGLDLVVPDSPTKASSTGRRAAMENAATFRADTTLVP